MRDISRDMRERCAGTLAHNDTTRKRVTRNAEGYSWIIRYFAQQKKAHNRHTST